MAESAPASTDVRWLVETGALFEALPQAVWLVAPDGEAVYLNPAARELLGLEADAPARQVAHAVTRLCTADGTPLAAEEHPARRALQGEVGAYVRLALAAEDGLRHLSVDFAPVQREGVIAGAIVQAVDRTLQDEIERARDDFLASVAHDLRSPLTAIRGSAQLGLRWARREPPPVAMLEQTLHTIDAAASRLNRILDTIMDSARIARGALLPQRAATDLVALVREVVKHHQAQTHRHQIALHAARRRIVGEWDEALLERAVENLIGNAVKYSPEGGPIDVTCAREGERARLAVRDHGVGIPADAIPHLFTRFYRARNVAMGEIEGNGLGLFTVKGIIAAHGGRIEVWSEEGVGTEVTLWLPLHPENGQA